MGMSLSRLGVCKKVFWEIQSDYLGSKVGRWNGK